MIYKVGILIVISCCTFGVSNFASSQSLPQGTKYVKRIEAKRFDHQMVLDSAVTFTYYDSLWKELKDENTLNTSLNKRTHESTVLDTPGRKEYVEVDELGDTLNKTIYLYNDLGKQTHHIALKGKDTTVLQLRKYDAMGNNIQLINREKGMYYLSMRWEYDENNEVILKERFNRNGDLIERTKRELSPDGKIVMTYKFTKGQTYELSSIHTKMDKLHTKTEYFIPVEGVNYGIKLVYEKGSYTYIEDDSNGNLRKLENFDVNDNLKTQVIVTYEDVK